MRALPVFLHLEDKPLLLVGGGTAAAAKLRLLLKAGARVTLVAATTCEELTLLARDKRVTWVVEDFSPALLDGHALAFGANGEEEENHRLSAAARAAHIPVNIVDRPELSDFLMPAIVDRGEIIVAVSTGGAAPVLAQRIRATIEDALPARIGALAAFARRFRALVQRSIADAGKRRRFWGRLIDGPIGAAVLAGDEALAARRLIRAVNGAPPEEEGSLTVIDVSHGDPGLLRLREVRALREAEVIHHEAGTPAAILDFARRDALRRLAPADPADDIAAGRRVVHLIGVRAARKRGRVEA